MAVALYARVSTTKQADKDLSIPDQLRQMREWCKRNGHAIGKEYIEAGAAANRYGQTLGMPPTSPHTAPFMSGHDTFGVVTGTIAPPLLSKSAAASYVPCMFSLTLAITCWRVGTFKPQTLL